MVTPVRTPSRWPVRLALVPLCAGLATLLLSSGLLLRTRGWLAVARHVQGTVVAAKLAQANSSPKTYHPVVRALDEAGTPFEITGTMSVAPAPTLGTPVELAYPPGRPQEAVIVSLFGLWIVPLVVALVGLVWTIIGIVLLSLSRRQSGKAQPTP